MKIRTLIGSFLLLQLISLQAHGVVDTFSSCDNSDSGSKCYNLPKKKSRKFQEIRNQAAEHIDQLNQKLFGNKQKKFENEANGPSFLLNEQRIKEYGSQNAKLPDSIRDQRNRFEDLSKPYQMPQKKDNSTTYGLGFSMKLDNNSEN